MKIKKVKPGTVAFWVCNSIKNNKTYLKSITNNLVSLCLYTQTLIEQTCVFSR